MNLSDVYVFVDAFIPSIVRVFNEKYLEGFKSMDSYYEGSKYASETIFETDSYSEMFEFGLGGIGRPFTFYLENHHNKKYKQSIIQINRDGSMCLALSTIFKYEVELCQSLKFSFPNYKVLVSNNIPLPSSKELNS
ncbi:hypothetical protein [Reichenbachiella versicolor]|uniref:hypothetical protein n=1 Tax=Reichenbachiella versicolor TaxID=1821036 RepID=UPI000D6E50D9|nr:hypothetical protein [Reichenbachiella versicolor]